MSDLAISVRGLGKSYVIAHQEKPTLASEALLAKIRNPFGRVSQETFWALKDVSFDVQKGDVLGIIGRNGAGKSTLLKVLSRITTPTTGEVRIYGRVGSLLEVGTGFHPELTGRENIFLNGSILGMRRSEIQKQFDEIVDFAEVEKFLDTPVKRYSSGMYVRLAFAVAAHLNPEILIVDEVLAVGDAQFQKKCLGKMQDVSRREGRTVLFVSHNMAAVRNLCRSSLVLRQGECLGTFSTDAAIELYQRSRWNSSSILESCVQFAHGVSLTEIRVQDGETPEINWQPGSGPLRISVRGSADRPLRASLEVTLTDLQDVPLAYFGEGHQQGESGMLPSGPFAWEAEIHLPDSMNEGAYALTIDLADHNVHYWIRGESCVRLHCEGTPTATGQPLKYGEKKGLIPLPGCVHRLAPVVPGSLK